MRKRRSTSDRRRNRSSGEPGSDSAADSTAARIAANPDQAAHAIALRELNRQPRTRAELARILRRRGVPGESADRILDRLEEVGLVDDEVFAGAWVDSRHAGRGLARRALARELRDRGVDRDVVEAATDRIDDEAELATARSLVERRLAGTRRLDPPVRLRRLMGMLARKGYSGAVAMTAIEEALRAEGDDQALDLLHEVEGSITSDPLNHPESL